MLTSTLLSTLAVLLPSTRAASWIASNTVWYDTDGNVLDAHGGGIVQRDDTFYWVGHSAGNCMFFEILGCGQNQGPFQELSNTASRLLQFS